MDNTMTEEGTGQQEQGTGGCLACFNKIGNYGVLSNEESQKVVNNWSKYLHKNIANSKWQTAESIDENQLPLCKKCFEAASDLTQLSEHVENCRKQISDLSFEFSLGVLARRTQVESVNNKSDDSPKEFVVLDVSRISPSFFSIDELIPNKMEESEHLCENSFFEMDAVLNVPQYRLEIVKQEFNEYDYDNSQLLECPEETANLMNPLAATEDIHDGVAISNTTRNYPASKTGMESINNTTSQIDDSRSAGSVRSEINGTREFY